MNKIALSATITVYKKPKLQLCFLSQLELSPLTSREGEQKFARCLLEGGGGDGITMGKFRERGNCCYDPKLVPVELLPDLRSVTNF